MNEKQQGRAIELELTVNAPVEAVWEAIATADGLMRWFPIEARVERPGVGGTIWYSWGEGVYEGTATIVEWEPPSRLRMEYGGMTDEWSLVGGDGSTVVRVVTAGFSADEAGDEQRELMRRGWEFELAGLRHALERHLGASRHVASIRVPVSSGEASEVWGRLLGPTCLGLGSRAGVPKPGSVVQFVTGARDRLEADLLVHDPPHGMLAVVSDWDDALVRAGVGPPCTGGPGLEASVFVALHGDRAGEARELESRWGEMVRSTLA